MNIRKYCTTIALLALLAPAALAQGPQPTPQGPLPTPPGAPGAQQAAPAAPSLALLEGNFDPNQPIRAGFVVSVNTVSGAGPEMDYSGIYQVDPSGAIQMKAVGRVELRGLQPVAAGQRIASVETAYLKNPKVTVAIISVPRPVIFLGGAVPRSGVIPVNDGTTLAELLAILGYGDTADLSRVRIVHRDELGSKTSTEYNFSKWLRPAPGSVPDELDNPVLNDRDFIYIPSKIDQTSGTAAVLGDVVRQGEVPLKLGVPTKLREAISLAGGPNPSADRRTVTIRRAGFERPIVVDYDRLEAGAPGDNVDLMPDDTIYVQRLAVHRFVNMNGGFIRTGRLPYQEAMTLTQAIGDAGGLMLNVKDREGRIYRHPDGADPNTTVVIRFDYRRIRDGKDPDLIVQPGDTVEIQLANPPRPPIDIFQISQFLLSVALVASNVHRF